MRNNHFDSLFDFMVKEFMKDSLIKATFVSFVFFFVETEDRYYNVFLTGAKGTGPTGVKLFSVTETIGVKDCFGETSSCSFLRSRRQYLHD